MLYDLIVIGGGSGGLACAKKAATYGAKVALIERENLGGTCVNLGCVPKKITWNGSNIFQTLRHEMKEYCISSNVKEQEFIFDWKAFKNKRDAVIKRLNGLYHDSLEKNGVELIKGEALFDAQTNKVQVDQLNTIEGKYIVLATGSHPIFPKEIPGHELGNSSDDFFKLERQPTKVAIIGSGYIAVEMAGMLNALGSEVTIYCRQKRILTNFDEEIACFLEKQMEHQGIRIVKASHVKELKAMSSKKLVLFWEKEKNRDSEDCCYDWVLWAIGRGANSEKIRGLEKDDRGYIKVDDGQETSKKGIFALGDVTGKFMLTPVAIQAGRYLAERLFNNGSKKTEYENIPSVIFSHPPLAMIGLAEEEAKEKFGKDVVVYKGAFNNMFETMLENKSQTLYKMICLGKEKKIIGLHMVGRGSDEALQGFAVSIKMGATKDDFDSTVAIHPTASEEMIGLI